MATFNYQGKMVFYQVDGSDSSNTLLLLNGIMMSTKSWDPFVETFAKHSRLLRVDFLDQGQSDKMTDNYTQAIQVDLLAALLDHLDLSKVHVAGISYGGSIALQFAAKYGNRVDKLMLFNAVAKTSPWLKAIGDGWNEVAASRNGLAYYHIAIPMIYSPMFYTKRLEWMEERKKLLVPLFSDETFLNAMTRLTKSAETHDVEATLKSIDNHTLIIASEEDYLTPPFEQVRLANALPNASLITFNDCGHASMYEKPDLFVSTILGFMQTKDNYPL